VEYRAGDKYCEFCGTKVSGEVEIRPPADRQKTRAVPGPAAGMLKGIALACLAVGILAYVGSRRREQHLSPAPPPIFAGSKQQAAAICEAAIRLQVRAPLRAIAFRSILVAEDGAGYAVSGSVELQSTAGDLQRKRYYCRARSDASSGMVLDEAKLD
jgi:hypothetical protein